MGGRARVVCQAKIPPQDRNLRKKNLRKGWMRPLRKNLRGGKRRKRGNQFTISRTKLILQRSRIEGDPAIMRLVHTNTSQTSPRNSQPTQIVVINMSFLLVIRKIVQEEIQQEMLNSVNQTRLTE